MASALAQKLCIIVRQSIGFEPKEDAVRGGHLEFTVRLCNGKTRRQSLISIENLDKSITVLLSLPNYFQCS